MFVTERAGRVQLLRDGAVRHVPRPHRRSRSTTARARPAVDGLRARLRDLRALLRLSDRARRGRARRDARRAAGARVPALGADPDVADPASGRLLLAIRHDQAGNHNGGQLQFGPDGKLWLATGDGGGRTVGNAQDPESLLGKLIRLDPAAPAPEVMARGLRNPWRFSFDRATGQLVLADVGDGAFEEINVGLAANYGWPCFEGTTRHGGEPRLRHRDRGAGAREGPPGDGFCSITGGYVVRDPGLPTLLGRYLYGDYCERELRSVDLAGPRGDAPTGLSVASLSSFGEDACGRLFVVSLDGPVYRLVDGSPSPCAPAARAAERAAAGRDTRACACPRA